MVVDWTTIYFLQRRSNTISRSWARGDGALLFGLAVTGGRRMSELEPHFFRWRYFVMSFLLLEKFWFNQLKELIEPLSPKKNFNARDREAPFVRSSFLIAPLSFSFTDWGRLALSELK